MSIPLPLMNNLCKHWTLPNHIIRKCDLYYLKHISDPEFAAAVQVKDTHMILREHGVDFEVIFQHGAAQVYTHCGELDKRKEPNDVHYWLSFRSLTFSWNGKDCTKSYVLVQVDKGQKKPDVPSAKPVPRCVSASYVQVPEKKNVFREFKTFIEKSAGIEKEQEE